MQGSGAGAKGRAVACATSRVDEPLGRRDVRIALKTVGVCGSDVHYYTHGGIGPFVVEAADDPGPRGRRRGRRGRRATCASSRSATGSAWSRASPIPTSRAVAPRQVQSRPGGALLGDAAGARHPAADRGPSGRLHLQAAGQRLVRRRRDGRAAGVGVHAATKAQIQPGDIAVVIGAGPIGMVTVLAALAAGCARVHRQRRATSPSSALAEKLGAVDDRQRAQPQSSPTW